MAWELYLNQHPLGWALSEINQQSTDTTEIHSLVHIDSLLPLEEILPIWIRLIARQAAQAAGSREMEVESDLITNSALDQLLSFSSKFRPKGGQSLVKIEGNVDGDKLKLDVHLGDYDNPNIELPMPDSKIRDSFSPEMELRGLRLGQSWTIVSYSPLSLPTNPLAVIQGRPPTEVLFAKVEDRVPLTWDGLSEPTWLVVYRTDSSEGPDSDKNIRNRLWIRRDGTVVRQELLLGEHSLMFKRSPEKDAVRLRDEHKDFTRHQAAAHP